MIGSRPGLAAGDARPRIHEAACWAHVRRKFFDIHASNTSPLAAEALNRVDELLPWHWNGA